MAYEKQTFKNGDVLTAEHMNAMGQGIADVSKHFAVSGGDTLTWDGNTEGLVCVGDVFYKIHDQVPMPDLANGLMVDTIDGVLPLELSEVSPGIIMSTEGVVIFISEEGVGVDTDGISFPEPGVYCVNIEGFHPKTIIIRGYTGFGKEVLKPDILPKALQFGDSPTGGDTLTWDGNTDGRYTTSLEILGQSLQICHISDAVPTKADVENNEGLVLKGSDGTSTGYDDLYVMMEDDGSGSISFAVFIIPHDGYEYEGDSTVTIAKKGTYVTLGDGASHFSSLTIPGYTGFPSTKKLDAKYLPEHLQFGDRLTEIVPETEIVGELDGETYTAGVEGTLAGDEETLIVTFDGVEYTCRANTDMGTAAFGNMKYAGGEDTGEPFLIFSMGYIAVMVENAEPHRVGIKAVTVQKLDGRYTENSFALYISPETVTNPYIYTDAALTTKATKADLYKILGKQNAQVCVVVGGVATLGLAPLIVDVVSGCITICDWRSVSPAYIRMGTAEYTPT